MDGPLPGSIDTVVIGAGQAGLLMSWHLQRAGRLHVVLDRRETLGGGWQDRWDGFRLVGPNWTTELPGYPYDGGDPDGFMARDAVAARMRRYATEIGAPVHRATEVTRLSTDAAGDRRFRLETSAGTILADDVIVATGPFHTPKVPAGAAGFSTRLLQVHAHDYRNPIGVAARRRARGRVGPDRGPTRGGTARSRTRGRPLRGTLRASAAAVPGPRLLLVVARTRRAVDQSVGVPLPSVGQLPDPRMRFACNPHLSGHGGGHETNLRQMARDGIRLAGRFSGADGERASFAADLPDNLRFADDFFDQRFKGLFDSYAERA